MTFEQPNKTTKLHATVIPMFVVLAPTFTKAHK